MARHVVQLNVDWGIASMVTAYDRRAVFACGQSDFQDDWEGTGVEPDVPIKAADALDKAEKLAASKLTAQQ